MSPKYGELRPNSGWDRFTSLGHPCKFEWVSRLGSVTARHLVVGVSQTLRRGTEGATYVRQGDHHVGHWPTFLVFCLFLKFFCTVTDFSAAEKARGVKFCMHLGLLSGQVFSPLEVKGQGHQGQKTRLALQSPTRLPYEWYVRTASDCCCGAGRCAHFLAGEGWNQRWCAPRLGIGGSGID